MKIFPDTTIRVKMNAKNRENHVLIPKIKPKLSAFRFLATIALRRDKSRIESDESLVGLTYLQTVSIK